MKTAILGIVSAVAITSLASWARASVLVDDFSGASLNAAYTQTRLLDNNSTPNITFGITAGALTATDNSSDTTAEQQVLLRSDFSLAVGQTLRADMTVTGGSQDFGIAVGATSTPASLIRSDYFYIGARSTADHVIAGGFDGAAGTTGLTTLQNQPGGTNAITGLFIKRTSTTGFDVGYNYNGGADTTLGSYTVTNTNIGNAIGFYTDMRASGTIGSLDNLRIDTTPEPASIGLLAVGAAGLLARRRK